MARTRGFDTDRILTRSMETFWSRGYKATSIEDLTSATGLSRSSLYQAFGSKRGVFEAAVGTYLGRIEEMMAPLLQGEGGLGDVISFFEGMRRAMDEGADGSLGCLVVNAVAELGHEDAGIREIGDRYTERFDRAFLRPLRVAEARGEIEAATAERRAELLTLLTYGVFIASRGQEQRGIERVLDLAVAEVESWRA